MLYIKFETDGSYIYPYNLDLIYSDNPEYSFPAELTAQILQQFSIFQVEITQKPQISYTENIVEDMPEKSENVFKQKWSIVDASPEEISSRVTQEWVDLRKERNRRLSSSDWTQISDNNLSNEQRLAWQEYRQLLRDITSTQENPFDIVFPLEPTL